MEKRYAVNTEISFGDEGDEGAVLFNPDTDDAVIINGTGKTIWQFINEPHTPTQITQYLLETFEGCAAEQVDQDVDAFLKDLLPDFVNELEA